MASYYRKLSKGIFWFYKFDLDGKTYRSHAIYHGKKEALAAERERYNKLDEERRFGKADKPISLNSAINDRLKFLEVKYSKKNLIDNTYYLKLFSDFIGNPDIREISRKIIDDFLIDYSATLANRGLDNYQVNAALKTVKALFNHAISRHDLLIKNPCQNIKKFPISKHLKYIPTDDEIEFLRSKLNRRQLLLFDFVKDTGCRINEALNLNYSDIKDGYVILYTRKSKNSDRIPRKVPCPDCVISLKGFGPVFPDWQDTPKFLDKTLRANGRKIWGWHALRHRYASLLSKKGTPLFELMSLLGHSQLLTTQRYLQMLP